MDFLKITGYCSYYNVPDYHNDVVIKGAFKDEVQLFQKNNKKIPLLVHHNPIDPIAKITKIIDQQEGLYIEASIENNNDNSLIINQLTKDLVSDLSVGIIPIEYHYENNLRIIKKAKLLEISLVTIGANPQAKILSVENFSN